MGWTFHYNPPRDPKAEVARMLTFETDAYSTEVVKHSVVGSTHYVAVKSTPKPGQTLPYSDHEADPDTGSQTWAAIFLTHKDRDGCWGYKDMTECMGPVESKAPLSLLNVLSPTTSEYAQAWRERCRTYARRPKPKIGDTVRLHEPWEPYGDLFTKIEWPRTKSVYRSVKTGQAVRLRGSQIKEIV